MYGKYTTQRVLSEKEKLIATYKDNPIIELYNILFHNLKALDKVMPSKWIHISDIQTADTSIWSWDSEEEKEATKKEIKENGFYFPIVVLEKGFVHAQKEDHIPKDKHYVLDGNHRVSCAQELFNSNEIKDPYVLAFIAPDCLINVRQKLKLERRNYDYCRIPRSSVIVMPYKKEVLFLEEGSVFLPLSEKYAHYETENLLELYNAAFSVMHNITPLFYELDPVPEKIKEYSKRINNFEEWAKYFHPDLVTIAEVAGSDSIAAIIKAFEREDIKYILPVSIMAKDEYGEGPDTLNLKERIRIQYNMDKVLLSQENMEESIEFTNVSDNYCINCHNRLHMQRALMALHYDKRIISGERLWHDDKKKVNQDERAIAIYDRELSRMGVSMIRPIYSVKEQEEIKKILDGLECKQYLCKKKK